jgi:hypothetical protein
VPAQANAPRARSVAAAYVDDKGQLWLFGGGAVASVATALNDLWRFSTKSFQFTW